ncbi:hypothetical protein CAPTEDRAFT_199397 [Capitella teleta]|uniref:Uncharacterized protein n=1 Tax=Capitella teleta TaxID=283909 RepID=R7UX78_CAPTE|nr:hypothetical protein CAPTEDRAFT_199397 [Capitella teleta]|eukprot:ELU10897.1 hypothetical protein CAPTEDRAFT_199397 [Capitella teleta]
MKCGDPAVRRDSFDSGKERLPYGDPGARVQTQRMVFWAAPAVCFALTVAMATPSSFGGMTTSLFASLQLVTDDKTAMEGLYAEGGMHQRSVITLVVFLYLPVLYLYRATGRLAKVYDLADGDSSLDVNRLTAQRAFQLLLPARSHGSNLLHVRGVHDTLVHYALVYLQLLWALNLYVYRCQADFWQRWVPKVSAVHKVSARSVARLRRLCPPVLAKFWLGKASSKAQEARRGGQKDWKKLKKAWALKSWADLQHRDVLCTYNNRSVFKLILAHNGAYVTVQYRLQGEISFE